MTDKKPPYAEYEPKESHVLHEADKTFLAHNPKVTWEQHVESTRKRLKDSFIKNLR